MAPLKKPCQIIGKWGERLAEDYLIAQGYHVLGKNIRTAYGEIDILAQLEEEIVFVEVKTRTNLKFGLPEQGITRQKQSHMLQSAEAYFQLHPEMQGNWRIDVIAIKGSPRENNPEIIHFENALT